MAEAKHPQKQKKRKTKPYVDYSLIFAIVFLTAFGLLMVFSASSYQSSLAEIAKLTRDANPGRKINIPADSLSILKKQAIIALAGFAVMAGAARFNFHRYLKFAWFGYYLSIFLMILVSLVGNELNGKKRWFKLPGNISFQPSEFAKLAMILFLSVYIARMKQTELNSAKGFWKILGLDAVVAACVAYNNLSAGIIVGSLAFIMSFVAARKYFWHLVTGGAAAAIFVLAPFMTDFLMKLHLLKQYQAERILVWQHPELYPQDGGFQVLQSLYAVGSGGLMGKGLGESIQKLGHIPEPQNDMIFAIICEELGLFGAVSLILVYIFILYRLAVIAVSVQDRYGALFTVGVIAHISVQVILNIAVATNSMPNTGISLPFVSAGGTSLLFLMFEVGIVMNIARGIRTED